jgi:hypothetical protein
MSPTVGRPLDTARKLARETNSLELVHAPMAIEGQSKLVAAVCACGWERLDDHSPAEIADAAEHHLREVHHVNVVKR